MSGQSPVTRSQLAVLTDRSLPIFDQSIDLQGHIITKI